MPDAVGVDVTLAVPDDDGELLSLGELDCVGERDALGVGVLLGVAPWLLVCVPVAVPLLDGVAAWLAVCVSVDVTEGVRVAVPLGVES